MIRILKENGKYIGIPYGDTRPEAIAHWHSMGIDTISVGSDYGYLYECGTQTLENLRTAHTAQPCRNKKKRPFSAVFSYAKALQYT